MGRWTKIDPLHWSDVDKCLLWLGLVLSLFVFFLYRVDHLLLNPTVEPYFDRDALRLFHRGLVVVTLAAVVLFLIGLVGRRRTAENPSILHGANQLWWISASIAAYAIGPFTTPILGLLLLGGFLSLLLFPRRVVVPALTSGMILLVVTTVAERAHLLPYAPLFNAQPGIGGRLSTPYVVGTGVIAFGIIVASFFLVSSLVERGRLHERALRATGGERERAQVELRQALASLRDTEERFRQLTENAREIFWLVDVETGKLLYVSPTFEAMWGMSVADVYERPERFLERVHPDDRARMADELPQLGARVAAGAAGGDVEYRLIPADGGGLRWLQVRGFPIRNAAGRIYRVGGLIEDVTERRSAEAALRAARAELEQRVTERTAELLHSNERLREEAAERRRAESALRDRETQLREQFNELEHLYQNAPIGLCFHDAELRYVRINERLAAINGQPVAAHIGRTLWDVIPEIAATVGPIMRGVLATGEPALDIELHTSTPADPETERFWLTSYYPVQSSDGRTLGISAVVQDISEVKWAEERARRHLESLAHVSRLSTMGQMATGIAHELNQPLAAIANYAFVGRQKLGQDGTASPAEIRKVFDELSALALRAGGIVQHLRAFVKKAHSERVTTSVNALIGDVLTLLGAELRLAGIQPVLRLDETLPPVRVDTVQVQQVILNLIRNALDAMPEGAPAIRDLTITSTITGDMIEVAIRDSGKGLSIKGLDQLFDPFYTTKSEGMGMGLAISRSIIEDHGGRLWAEANPDNGMTFRFSMPVAAGNGETAA